MTILNIATLRSMSAYGFGLRFQPDAPLVSILIPARNEASNIAHCLRSLLNQDYPNIEIIVLDDNSEDATFSIVDMLARPTDDPQLRLRLIKGQELPEGWLGKNFACHQLAAAAAGQFLLFTDADTAHNANSVSSALAALLREKADFLTLFPAQQVVSLAERLAVPLITKFFTYGLLPTLLISRHPDPAFSASNGQFMLFRRAAYDHIGGHAAVKYMLLEDVILGRRIKQAGFKAIMPDARDCVSCRMYRSSQEVWRGFSKNLFAFFNFKAGWLLAFLALNLLAFVGPYGWLLLGFMTQRTPEAAWLWLPLAQIVLAWLARCLLAVRYGFPLLDIFLHPLAILYTALIALNSMRWSRRATEWKGRKYRISQ